MFLVDLELITVDATRVVLHPTAVLTVAFMWSVCDSLAIVSVAAKCILGTK